MKALKYILVCICCFAVGAICMNLYNRENYKYVECNFVEGNFENVNYIPNYEVKFYNEDDYYFFDVWVETNEFIDFTGYENDSMYISLSFDGRIPFSIDESNHKIIEIPLNDGKLPDTFHFRIDKNDNAFKDEDLNILNEFLEKKTDSLIVSLNLYNPEGIIEQVANQYIQ